MRDVIYEMSRKALGMTCVVNGDNALLGIITDGDLRRHMERERRAFSRLTAGDVMTQRPGDDSGRDMLAVEALNIMEQRKITSIVVVDDGHSVAGVVHLHDLWRTEMVVTGSGARGSGFRPRLGSGRKRLCQSKTKPGGSS